MEHIVLPANYTMPAFTPVTEYRFMFAFVVFVSVS